MGRGTCETPVLVYRSTINPDRLHKLLLFLKRSALFIYYIYMLCNGAVGQTACTGKSDGMLLLLWYMELATVAYYDYKSKLQICHQELDNTKKKKREKIIRSVFPSSGVIAFCRPTMFRSQ